MTQNFLGIVDEDEPHLLAQLFRHVLDVPLVQTRQDPSPVHRISASSRTPPKNMRTNGRLRARAMLWPRLVLPTPGGPTKQRIGSQTIRKYASICERSSAVRQN